ncbi:MAG: hypothetical protein WCD31_09750, partial [Gillisia sp.]
EWKKYLHPKFQQRRFFPSLWPKVEKEEESSYIFPLSFSVGAVNFPDILFLILQKKNSFPYIFPFFNSEIR